MRVVAEDDELEDDDVAESEVNYVPSAKRMARCIVRRSMCCVMACESLSEAAQRGGGYQGGKEDHIMAGREVGDGVIRKTG